MLSVSGLSKSFGGVAAVHDVTFNVRAGSLHSVIGPNGAGKTTLFNLISGVYLPSGGNVSLFGEDVTGLSAERLARRGISRTFQNLQICMNMTACENVMLGGHRHTSSGILPAMLGTAKKADRVLRSEALRLMHDAGIGELAFAHATELSFGALKRLEIARALASRPKLLLLDEPAAGLNETETHELGRLIKNIIGSGITVLLVEHDMKMVMTISDEILVLDYGKKLAEGTPEAIKRNPQVVAAYLGTD